MKQTESAVRMLISAYKAVLTNCYIKENLLGGGKRLVKGAALSSFLTAVLAGISSPSFAVVHSITSTVTETPEPKSYSGNLEIKTGNEEAIYGSNSSIYIEVTKDEVNSGNLTLNIDESHGIKADLKNKEDQISLLADGDISINVIGDNKDETGDGINVSNNNLGSINITAGHNNIINAKSAHGDGIKVESGEWCDADAIKLTARTGNNEIKSGNNGIDHGGSQQILLQADQGINKITTVAEESDSEHKEITGDGIRIGTDKDNSNSSPSGKVILEALSNIINAEDAGLNNSGSSQAIIDISASLGPNIISGNKEAVLINGSGSITVKAHNDNSGISLLTEIGEGDYYNKHTNIFGGGENGIHATANSNGIFTAIADENNYISGSVNGIWTEESSGVGPTLNIEAGKDNIIGFTGQVSDSDGEILEGFIGQNGITINSGTVNLTAENENKINATKYGVYVKGDNSYVTLDGNQNTLSVKSTDSKQINTSGIYVSEGADFNIGKYNENNTIINVTGAGKYVYGVYANKSSDIKILTNTLSLLSNFNGNLNGGTNVRGIYSSQSSIDIDAIDSVFIDSSAANVDTETAKAHGIYAETKDSESGTYANSLIDIDVNSISIKSSSTGDTSSVSFGIEAKSVPDADTNATVNITAYGLEGISVFSVSSGTSYGINAADNAQVNLISNSGDVYISAIGGNDTISAGVLVDSIDIALSPKDVKSFANIKGYNNNIYGSYSAVYANYGKSFVDVEAINGENDISGGSMGILSQNGASVSLKASETNFVHTEEDSYGIYATNIASNTFTNGKDATVSLIAQNNSIYGASYGVYGYRYADVTLNAETENNYVSAKNYGIYSTCESSVRLIADNNNYIYAGDVSTGYGTGYAIYTLDNGGFSGSNVSLQAHNYNKVLGAAYANGLETTVTLSGLNGAESKSNVIRSYAKISNAGDLSSEDSFKEKSVISALYAEQGANITLNGTFNDIGTYADNTDTSTLERTVWAYNGYDDNYTGERIGSEITIKGDVQIKTDRYVISPDSLDVAIAAGTRVNLDKTKVSKYITDKERAKVDINYSNISAGWLTDNNSNDITSYNIEGDILSAYEGLINIDTADADAGINIHGNLLAGNNGILNVNLGKNGVLTGRADDYGDAGFTSDEGHSSDESFSDPAFSSAIYKGGEVNLEMGEGSRWNVTGQSWITRIEASDDAVSETSPLIDLVSANSDRNTNAQALTVYELKGNVAFNMNLDGNRDVSDMLYIKNAQGEYTVNVIDSVSVADMYANGHTGLRFATLGAGSNASFRAITWDDGVNNIEYEVATDDYDTSTENTAYNGVSLTDGKPGDDTVDTFFGSDGEPGSTTPAENADENIETQTVAANVKLAKAVVENADIETTAASDTLNTDATNYKLVAVKSSEISDGGKTVIDMSRANYANAVYMDTLNKRQGEARFVGDTDHGVWVRLRHDNIGKDDSFRTHNTMVEVGFEQRDVNDYGEFHTGFALDYMNGQIDYHTVDGDGDIERYGVWFYTTYLGNDGQYADLVLKYGHLKNDFGFNTRSQGEHVTGDYTNEVASISAEYGWKFSNSYNYYIEPQVQLQYSYVTGADYTTSQGSKVDLDSIHSLIGRVGFRAGKDFNTETPITAYIRGDVLHEFLGDQDIYAYDNTGVMDVTYENDDTWYSAGVGLSVQSSENTYFFIEGEQVFGSDNDNTYTVSGGFKHSF